MSTKNIRINLRLKLSKAASLISSASRLSSFSFSFFCISSASFRKIFERCRCPQVTDSVRNTLLQCQIYAAEKKTEKLTAHCEPSQIINLIFVLTSQAPFYLSLYTLQSSGLNAFWIHTPGVNVPSNCRKHKGFV